MDYLCSQWFFKTLHLVAVHSTAQNQATTELAEAENSEKIAQDVMQSILEEIKESRTGIFFSDEVKLFTLFYFRRDRHRRCKDFGFRI
jgi:hypothetical protein